VSGVASEGGEDGLVAALATRGAAIHVIETCRAKNFRCISKKSLRVSVFLLRDDKIVAQMQRR